VSVAVQHGNVTGIAFLTAGPSSEAQVRAGLSEMFGAESGQGTAIQCRFGEDIQRGTVRSSPVNSTQHQWSPPHIVVEYQPVSGTACDFGLVRIQTAQLTEAFARPVPR